MPTADVKLEVPIQTHRLLQTTPTEVHVPISLTENVARTATLAPGLGLQMTPSSGAQPMPLADANLAVPTEARIRTHHHQRITLMVMPVQTLRTANAAQTATLAPGLGPSMTLSNGAPQMLPADVSLVAPTTREATVTLTMTRTTTAATLQTLTIPFTSINGAMHATPIRPMIARK